MTVETKILREYTKSNLKIILDAVDGLENKENKLDELGVAFSELEFNSREYTFENFQKLIKLKKLPFDVIFTSKFISSLDGCFTRHGSKCCPQFALEFCKILEKDFSVSFDEVAFLEEVINQLVSYKYQKGAVNPYDNNLAWIVGAHYELDKWIVQPIYRAFGDPLVSMSKTVDGGQEAFTQRIIESLRRMIDPIKLVKTICSPENKINGFDKMGNKERYYRFLSLLNKLEEQQKKDDFRAYEEAESANQANNADEQRPAVIDNTPNDDEQQPSKIKSLFEHDDLEGKYKDFKNGNEFFATLFRDFCDSGAIDEDKKDEICRLFFLKTHHFGDQRCDHLLFGVPVKAGSFNDKNYLCTENADYIYKTLSEEVEKKISSEILGMRFTTPSEPRSIVSAWFDKILKSEDPNLKIFLEAFENTQKNVYVGLVTLDDNDRETSTAALYLFSMIVFMDKTLLEGSATPEEIVEKFSQEYPKASNVIQVALEKGDDLSNELGVLRLESMRELQDYIYKKETDSESSASKYNPRLYAQNQSRENAQGRADAVQVVEAIKKILKELPKLDETTSQNSQPSMAARF